jgi:cytoskeletal protein RodZ
MRWLRRLQRVRTSTWILLAIFLVALAAYLVVRPDSATTDTTAQTHDTTSPTPPPATTRPTPSPKATHASPTPGLGSTPHSSVSPSPSPSPLGSPSPSASDPTPSPQAS